MQQYIFIIGLILLVISCSSDNSSELETIPNIPKNEQETVNPLEEFPGGTTSINNKSPKAFNFAARGLNNKQLSDFGAGNSFFTQNWVSAPASTTARDGLGPFFNSRSCSGCHSDDGRGRTPLFDGELSHGLLLRLSIGELDNNGFSLPDPIYGGQLQDQSILGIKTQGNIRIVYKEKTTTYPDGITVSLRKPMYAIDNLGYGKLDARTKFSPRIANHMIGLGLLEAISEETLLSFSDENDTNNDGISGKPNYVFNIREGKKTIGKFGWKANNPTVEQQVAGAFLGDLGLTSELFPKENCTSIINCNEIPNGGTPEITERILRTTTFYSQTIAVPLRRNFDKPNILKGKTLFNQVKCNACHIPKIQTGTHPIKLLSNQIIYPYTDLLLHDMGEGLADELPDFDATPNEWRTPPLWSIGLFQTVNKHTNLLHDGRARNVEEAILWHGGEAENSKNTFINLTAVERGLLIDFVNSL